MNNNPNNKQINNADVESKPYVDWAKAIHAINKANNIKSSETLLDTIRRLRFIHNQQLNNLLYNRQY